MLNYYSAKIMDDHFTIAIHFLLETSFHLESNANFVSSLSTFVP